MIDRTRIAVLFGLLGLACGLQCPKQKISPGREVVCYTSVSEVELLTESICRCTTLVQKGLNVQNLSVSEFEDFRKSVKEIVPTLQFVISVDDPAQTLRTSGIVRQEITARLIGVLKEVDGVELNMTAGTKERLVHFVKGLKDEFLRKSYDKRIFLVLPTKSEDLAKQYDLKELSKYVDLFTVPTHYLVEDDESYRTFHPSRLMGLFDMFNADSLIDLISGLGAPKRKILMSVPSSAYKFTLKDRDDNAPSAPTEEMQPIVIDQKQLCDLMNKGEWTVERDEDLTAPYSFKDKMWIAFEDRISASIKGKYVLVRDLPGLGIYDIENDFKTECGSPITHDIHHSFMDFKRKSRAAVLNALEDDLHQRELEYSTKVKSSEFRVVRVVDTEGHIRVVRENTQTEFTCSRQGYFVHPKSCNRFYRCVKFNQEVEDYSVFEFDCPTGLSFDENTEVCVWPGSMPEGSPCPGSSEIAPVTRVRFHCSSQTGYFADPQNPRWFFACIDLGGPEIMAYEFRCPYGLIFDEQKLICEWPWLVVTYTASGYVGSDFDRYTTGSTPGTGGYYTGALPQGYTGTLGGGGGGYASTTIGTASGSPGGVGSTFGQGIGGYTGTPITKGYGSYGDQGLGGFSGSAEVGGQGTLFNQGTNDYSVTAGIGYTGSTRGPGVTYTGQETGGYSGTGRGYPGSAGISHGTTYTGQETDSYSGTPGTGYSGSAGKDHGTSYIDQGSIGYSGTTGSGYTGTGIDHGYSGTGTINYGEKTTKTGSPYDQSGAGPDHYGPSGVYTESHTGQVPIGHARPGQVSTGYTGTEQVPIGHARPGQVSTGYTGTEQVPIGHARPGQVSTGYTGTEQVPIGHAKPGQVSTGYTGTEQIPIGSGQVSTGRARPGQVSTGYTGTGQVPTGYTGTGQVPTGYTGTGRVPTGYTGTGQVSTGYIGTGQVPIGHARPGQVSTGYTGTEQVPIGHARPGQVSTGYTGTEQVPIGSGQVSTGRTRPGQVSTGYTGTGQVPTGYTGTGQVPTGYTGTGRVPTGYTGTDQVSTGYTRPGQVSTGYTSPGQVSTGYTRPGEVSTGYTRPGQVSTGYTRPGQISTGYTRPGQVSTEYTRPGQVSTGYTRPGQVSTGYTRPGQVSTGYSETGGLGHTETNGIYSGATGTSYTGPSKTGTNLEYSGQDFISHGTGSQPIDKGYPGTIGHGGYTSGTNVQFTDGYSGGTPTIVTEDYSGSGIKDSLSGVKSPGATYESTKSGPSAGTGYIYTGQTGTKFPGSKTGGQSEQSSQTPIYTFSGTTGAGPTKISQTPIFVDKPNVPTCITIQCSPPPPSSQTYTTDDYISNHGITSETNVYQVTGEYGGLNGTLGGHVPSTPYYGDVTSNDIYKIKPTVGTGGISIPGHDVQGSIISGPSTPGTLNTYGGSSGTVFTGPSDQGSILTGVNYPGYTKTGPSTPGYVVSDGIKTAYGSGTSSPGTVIYGKSSDVVITGAPKTGTIIKGQTSPGLILKGQTGPGISIGGSIDQGTIGSTGHHVFTDSDTTPSGIVTPGYSYGTKIASVSPSHGTGYKTNEYYDNEDNTVRFNSGGVTIKYREKDFPDYRPSGESIPPDTLIPGSRDRPSYPSGFTKTGPTKTGFTTAALGAGDSYVSTGKSTPSNLEHIGAKAFEGNVAGYPKSSTESSVSAGYPGTTSTYNQDIDQSKPNLGLSKSPGYSYPTPGVPFDSGVTKNLPISSTKGSFVPATTPTPFLNMESYSKPSELASPTVGTYQRPSGFTHGPTSIGTSVGHTTGPFDNYKTTAFEPVKIPAGKSTIHPLADTGHKTIASSTSLPMTIIQDKHQPKFDFGIKTTQQGDYITSTPQTKVFKIIGSEIASTTPSSSSPYFTTTKNMFETVTPSGISESLKPKSQYLPSGTISPAIDTTYQYKKPIPGVTYQQSTPATSQGYTVGSVTGSDGSPTNVGISKEEVGKLVTNYRGNAKYVPSQYDIYTPGSISGTDYSNIHQQSPTSGPGYVAPTSGPGYVAPTSGPGYVAPTSGPGYVASTSGPGYVAPTSGPGYVAPTSGPGYVAPTSGPGYVASTSGPGYVAPTSGPGYVAPTSGPGYVASTSGPGYVAPTSGPGYVAPTSGPGYVASTSGPGYVAPTSGPGYVASTSGPGYVSSTSSAIQPTQLPFSATTYSGDYSKPSSIITYQSTAKSTAVGKGKVIVKWSDLHPLLLGKLGAECTCRGDPFANLRGPGSKLIDSSKGRVDLSNYDESDIYVDLEKENGSYEDRDYESSKGPIKIWNNQIQSHSQETPSSGYLPSVTPSISFGSSPSTSRFTANYRSGKSLNNVGSSTNVISVTRDLDTPANNSDGDSESEEIIDGATNCARPGLFRHPNFCNKFYACHWDEFNKKFTLHMFNCPVHLTFDNGAGACNWPSMGPACQDDNLLV